MKNIEYYDRMAKDLYNTAYSDGYGDGLQKGKENTVSTQEERHIVQESQKSR